ncbi:hypothetical protein F5051DRAFT_442067 [Lentinula edodes]|nr:hypothetical protein F5051DRAFT_442067 [Lentinula edodes]
MDHDRNFHHPMSYPDQHHGPPPPGQPHLTYNPITPTSFYDDTPLSGNNQNTYLSAMPSPSAHAHQTPSPSPSSSWLPSSSGTLQQPQDTTGSSPVPTSAPSMRVTPVVDPTIVDSLAKDFSLPDTQQKILQNYLQFGSAGSGLSKPDMLARLYDMAVNFSLFNQIPKDSEEESKSMRGLFKDIRIRLQQTFSITSTQNKSIRLVAMDKIYDPLRSCYRGVDDDVFDYIKSHADEMMFSNIFGNPAYEQALGKAIKKVSSSVRNAFRQHLRDGVANGTNAVDFTHSMNKIYRRAGGPHFNEQILLLRNVLLRRFIVDNPSAVWLEEDGLDVVPAEADSENFSPSPETQEQPAKKRKKTLKTAAGGRVPKGQDFWSLVDAWFIPKRKEFGEKLTDPRWRALLDDYVSFDEGGFNRTSSSNTLVPSLTSTPVQIFIHFELFAYYL